MRHVVWAYINWILGSNIMLLCIRRIQMGIEWWLVLFLSQVVCWCWLNNFYWNVEILVFVRCQFLFNIYDVPRLPLYWCYGLMSNRALLVRLGCGNIHGIIL